jgi:uncharacterized protein
VSAIILWIIRALVILFALRLLLRLFFGARRPTTPGRRPGSAPAPGERAGGELVRDPQCGTYVARSRAIAAGSGSATVFFCSTACRDAYAAAHQQR